MLFPKGLKSWVLLLKCLFYCNIPCATLFVFFSAMRWWELLLCVYNCNCNIPRVATVWILVCFLFCREVMGGVVLCVKLYSLIYHVQLLCEYWFVFFFCREVMGAVVLFVKLELIDIPCAATMCLYGVKFAFVFFSAVRIDGSCCLIC